jgi:hypothetical protein
MISVSLGSMLEPELVRRKLLNVATPTFVAHPEKLPNVQDAA